MTENGGNTDHNNAVSAKSGASGADAAIAVSLGLNIANVVTTAEIRDTASVTITGDGARACACDALCMVHSWPVGGTAACEQPAHTVVRGAGVGTGSWKGAARSQMHC